jgi:hypothetical protein
MAPVHDTDIAEKRWSEGEWQHYELWERIEHRLRRRRWIWIAATGVVFLLISSVPVLVDRWNKWEALSLNRSLAQVLGALKLEAARSRVAMRLTFRADSSLSYWIESAESCSSTSWRSVREGLLGEVVSHRERFKVLTSAEGNTLGISGLAESFCYDSLEGAEATGLRAFGIGPVSDLSAGIDRRVSVLVLEGKSAEMSFE